MTVSESLDCQAIHNEVRLAQAGFQSGFACPATSQAPLLQPQKWREEHSRHTTILG